MEYVIAYLKDEFDCGLYSENCEGCPLNKSLENGGGVILCDILDWVKDGVTDND